MTSDEDPIRKLVAEGRHAEAAAAARASGDLARAAELYAKIWDFRAAAACAREAGDALGALRHLADARATDEALALGREIAGRGRDAARAAADVLAVRRLDDVAAELRETAGDREVAAALYQRAGRLLDAARLLADLGRPRDAGRLLERALHSATPATVARAHLALGTLLASLGEHEPAARHLQDAARSDASLEGGGSVRGAALARLVVSLAALGLRDAAADALASARALDPGLPLTVAEVVGRGAAPAADKPLAGGRYRLLRLLGSGGAGRVYLARDEVTGGEVAVKLFPVDQAHQDGYRRFVREAGLWARKRHAHIVEIYDFREEIGLYAMELMAGTLADRVARPLPAPLVRRIGLDVCAALAHAHAHGVVHRDVKPANVFLDVRGRAKLGDFGVAHLLELGATQTGALIGTLAYMSPEQITGAPITAAADLYALGVTLFQALTGRLPFVGPDYIAQHLGDPAPRPSQLIPQAVAWDPLLEGLLAKDPADRPASALAVGEALEALDAGARVVLSLPRTPEPEPPAPPPAPAPAPVAAGARLTAETPLGATAISALSRAVDAALDRTVIVERFVEGQPDAPALSRLLALARAQSPHLQRVLAWDPDTRAMVFEAPTGEPLAARALAPRAACRLLADLASAAGALHEAGGVHGAITAARILVDEDGRATLVAAGLGQPGAADTAADDVAACLAATTASLGAASVLDGLRPQLDVTPLAALPLATAADLYAFADQADLLLATL